MNKRIENAIKAIKENNRQAVALLRDLADKIESGDARLFHISVTRNGLSHEMRVEYITDAPPTITRKLEDFTQG